MGPGTERSRLTRREFSLTSKPVAITLVMLTLLLGYEQSVQQNVLRDGCQLQLANVRVIEIEFVCLLRRTP